MSRVPILLVEDDPDDVLLARRALQKCRVAIDVAVPGSGEEALEVLFHVPDGRREAPRKPALVLLDLKLPGIDGLEVLRRIRADATTRTLPVIVLSSSRAQKDVTACYELGANGFVQKSIDFDEFRSCMATLSEYWLYVNVPPVPHP